MSCPLLYYNICEEIQRWFDQNVEWKVGSGFIIKFWEDTWIGLDPLKLRFPRLYGNSILKDKVIKEFGKWENNKWEWGVKWRRKWFQWELPQVDEFENLIQQVSVNKESVDSWFWKDEEGKYTVKSGYSKIQNFPSGENSFVPYVMDCKGSSLCTIFGLEGNHE